MIFKERRSSPRFLSEGSRPRPPRPRETPLPPGIRHRRTLRARDREAGDTGDRGWEAGLRRKPRFGVPTGEGRVARPRGSAAERHRPGVLGGRAAPAQADPRREGGVKGRKRSGSGSRPERTAEGTSPGGSDRAEIRALPVSLPGAGADRWSPLPPAPPSPATAALAARGSGLGTLFGAPRSDPGGKAGEGPGAGGRAPRPRPRPQVRPAGGGGNFRSALGEARGGSFGEGAAAPPPPVPGEGEADPPWSLSSPLTNSLRILRPREPEGRTRLGKGRHVGGRTPSRRWGRGPSAARFGVQERRRRAGRAVHAQPGSRAEWRARATSFQWRGLGRRRGAGDGGERGPGTPELPCPGAGGGGGGPPVMPDSPWTGRKLGFCSGLCGWEKQFCRGHACCEGR